MKKIIINILLAFAVFFSSMALPYDEAVAASKKSKTVKSKKSSKKKKTVKKKKKSVKKKKKTRKKKRSKRKRRLSRKKRIQKSKALLKEYCPQYMDINSKALVLRPESSDKEISEDSLLFDNPLAEDDSQKKDDSNILLVQKKTDKKKNASIFSDIQMRFQLIDIINGWLGTPYKYAGRSKKGIDCSNFVSVVISEIIGKRFPAGASTQSKLFKPIRKVKNLQPGDILFFSGTNYRSKGIGHSAIYIGNGVFAHSSSYLRRGVVYSLLTEGKYMKRFRFAGRLDKKNWKINKQLTSNK